MLLVEGGRSPTGNYNINDDRQDSLIRYDSPERVKIMSKHLNSLQKEFLIHNYKSGNVKLSDFCTANNVSDSAFKKWLKQYDEAGLAGLARADAETADVFPEGIDKSEEALKREILKLRIENERLKKNYTVRVNEYGQTEYVPLKTKNSK